jgi:DNA-binding CsgD family transcriptional regulator
MTDILASVVPDWPQRELERAILAIGTAAFDQVMINCLLCVSRADYCFVCLLPQDRRPTGLLSGGKISDRLSRRLTEAYVDDNYRQDPNLLHVDACTVPSGTLILPFAIRRAYRRSYWDCFFKRARVLDKFATVSRQKDDRWLYSNFYRQAGSERFSSQDIERVRAFGPLLDATVTRHFIQLFRPLEEVANDNATNPARLVAKVASEASLTQREQEICTQIVFGYTSEGIALRLGISINSVLSYRKRAYAKLGITSANELFARALKSSSQELAVTCAGCRTTN